MSALWAAPPVFRGETVYLLGSGPSLDGFDYSLLEGRRVIAVNNAGLCQYRRADVLISTDMRWWQESAHKLHLFHGDTLISTEGAGIPDPRIRVMARRRKSGLSFERHILHGIYTGMHAAINLAVHFGAARIVLLGVDLRGAGERKYTYGGQITPRTARQFANMKAALESTAPALKGKNIDVVNASPDSALEIWPRCPPQACAGL